MSLVRNLFCSSLGKKYIMAVTGFVLVGFVTGHLVGNLQIFAPPDKINGYAQFLQSLGPVLWAVRFGLLACLILHVWAMTQLTLENHQARPVPYDIAHTIQATWASRSMRWTGFVVGAFLLYHLAHFTVGWAQSGTFKTQLAAYAMQEDFHVFGFPVVAKGAAVHDVFNMVVLGFQNLWVSLFYIVATGLLSLHLWHGCESGFQSLGWRTDRWGAGLRAVTRVYVVLYFVGSIAIPGGVLAGWVKPHAGVVATASCSCRRP